MICLMWTPPKRTPIRKFRFHLYLCARPYARPPLASTSSRPHRACPDRFGGRTFRSDIAARPNLSSRTERPVFFSARERERRPRSGGTCFTLPASSPSPPCSSPSSRFTGTPGTDLLLGVLFVIAYLNAPPRPA